MPHEILPTAEQLVGVIKRLIEGNDLRAHHGEDLIGVLMKCGAFHDTDPDRDPRKGDSPGLMALVHALDRCELTTYWQRHPDPVTAPVVMQHAFLCHQGRPWLRFSWPEGTDPPCFQCGQTVTRASGDGPLVCLSCSMGTHQGSMRMRERASRSSVLRIRLAQTDEDRARVREVGGDPEPTTVPDLAGELAWQRADEEDQAHFLDLITDDTAKDDA